MTSTEKICLSAGFNRGNFANAYETECFETALESLDRGGGLGPGPLGPWERRSAAYRAAFILGFFSSYSLAETPGSCREAFDEAYWSEYGQAVVKLGYSDSRSPEYEKEKP